jgi:hypothetical protein
VRPSGFPNSGAKVQSSHADSLALDFLRPALKRMIKVELFSATLKRCFPLLKQRAPTILGPHPSPL